MNSGSSRSSSTGSSSSDDDDEWGTVQLTTKTPFCTGPLKKCLDQLENTMFIPEPILSLESTKKKPKLRFLQEEEVPPGAQVWVGDEDDVELYVKNHWNSFYTEVCNGRRMGVVKRHSNSMTLISFKDQNLDMEYTLTLPRSCLSLTKIEPYDCCTKKNGVCVKEEALSTYFGKLNPRNTRTTSRESQLANQLFYEAVSVSAISTSGCPQLAKALEEFHAGAFSKALMIVNNILISGDVYPPRLVDVFLLRSRLFVFQNKYEVAMEDAQRCINLEPRWVRGYLSAARALSGLGDFDGAHKMIVTANSILPYTTELRHIMELNTFLRNRQKMLRKRNCTLSLDHLYRKRIKPCADVDEGKTMLVETMPAVIANSLFSSWPNNRCRHCFRSYTSLPTLDETESDMDEDLFSKPICLDNVRSAMEQHGENDPGYCSSECVSSSSAVNNFRKSFEKPIQQAYTKLKSIASLLIDVRPLEIGNLTIQMFFIVVQKHKYLLETLAKRRRSIADFLVWSDATDPPLGQRYTPTLNAALRHTGFFPLVSGHVGDHVKEIVFQVYNILVESMNEEEKKLYNQELFLGLYRYAHAYYVSLKLDHIQCTGSSEKFFFIPRFVGCVWGRSEIEWLARVEIDSGNWSSESQFEFSLRTAMNCSTELVNLFSREAEERENVLNYSNLKIPADWNIPVLALVAKKRIEGKSLLVPI